VTAFSNAAGLVSSIEEGARYKLLKSMIWEATWHSHITRVIIITISRTVQLLLRSDHGSQDDHQYPEASYSCRLVPKDGARVQCQRFGEALTLSCLHQWHGCERLLAGTARRVNDQLRQDWQLQLVLELSKRDQEGQGKSVGRSTRELRQGQCYNGRAPDESRPSWRCTSRGRGTSRRDRCVVCSMQSALS